MIVAEQRDLKKELIKLRQNPEFLGIRNLCRRTLRYIEKLEQRLEKQTSTHHRR